MTALLLALCSLSWGQSTAPVNAVEQLELQNLSKDVRELQSGRPTLTSLPKFLNGIKFGDDTTQTTAASAYNVRVGSNVVDSAQAGIGTTFTTLTGSTMSLTGLTVGRPIKCISNIQCAVTGFCVARYLVDGTSPAKGTAQAAHAISGNGNGNTTGLVVPMTHTATATSHHITVQAKTLAGTVDINCGTVECLFYCEGS